MTKRSSVIYGVLLIFFGAQLVFYRAFLPLFGLETGNGRLWPLLLANAGLIMVLAPFSARQHRGLGGLFIPGIPIMMISSMLLLASITDWWGLWAYLWPMIIIALAMGFVAAAGWMRNVWFLIPATIIGMNGLAFQFCAATGMWEVWAAIWPIELLAVGAALLLVNFWVHSKGLLTAGIILTVLSGFGFTMMGLLLSGGVSIFAALILIGAGVVLLGRNVTSTSTVGDGQPIARKEKLVETYSIEDVVLMKEAA